MRERYKLHAQRRFEESGRQKQEEKQQALLLLELDKNRWGGRGRVSHVV